VPPNPVTCQQVFNGFYYNLEGDLLLAFYRHLDTLDGYPVGKRVFRNTQVVKDGIISVRRSVKVKSDQIRL
jgi:hypothetical protein